MRNSNDTTVIVKETKHWLVIKVKAARSWMVYLKEHQYGLVVVVVNNASFVRYTTILLSNDHFNCVNNTYTHKNVFIYTIQMNGVYFMFLQVINWRHMMKYLSIKWNYWRSFCQVVTISFTTINKCYPRWQLAITLYYTVWLMWNIHFILTTSTQ